jgi:hypothetical protein
MCEHASKPSRLKKAGKWGLVLFVLHLMVHEVPILIGVGALAHSHFHSHGETP